MHTRWWVPRSSGRGAVTTLFTRSFMLAGLCLVACGKGDTSLPAQPAVMAPDGGGRLAGGTQGGGVAPGGNGAEPGLGGMAEPPPFRTSRRALVQWKRHAAFEADLMGALQLTRDQLCVEVGGKNCIRDVHLVPMGGNEPYESGLMKPSAEPLATTSSVVDRVLLSACSTRARLDAEGKPEVFTALDLKAPLPPASDPQITNTIRDLYRRFLARDPAPRELELVAELAENAGDAPLSSRDFAALSCFTIGSTTEFLFF
jgi:hypothetical protein